MLRESTAILCLVFALSACGRPKAKERQAGGSLRALPFDRAGGLDEGALGGVYSLTTDKAPAAVRPDPDVYVRRLIRQFRPESGLVAREIGRVEAFRLLLGGASEDFRTVPQETYDATSLLAIQTVSEELCEGLITPTSWEHPGWSSILPAPASDVRANVTFLAQRLLGLPSSRLPPDLLLSLENLVRAEAGAGGNLTTQSYVPACMALSTDAEALLL